MAVLRRPATTALPALPILHLHKATASVWRVPRPNYLLGSSPLPEFPGNAIYHDSNRNALLEPATDELIAILQSSETLTASNTITNASYQNAVNPSVVGISAVPVPAIIMDGVSPVLTAGFGMLESASRQRPHRDHRQQ